MLARTRATRAAPMTFPTAPPAARWTTARTPAATNLARSITTRRCAWTTAVCSTRTWASATATPRHQPPAAASTTSTFAPATAAPGLMTRCGRKTTEMRCCSCHYIFYPKQLNCGGSTTDGCCMKIPCDAYYEAAACTKAGCTFQNNICFNDSNPNAVG